MVKKIDAVSVDSKLQSFAVFLGDSSEELSKKLQELATGNSLKIPLTFPVKESQLDSYKLASDAVLTVVLYKNKKIVDKISLKKDELNKEKIETIIAEIKKLG